MPGARVFAVSLLRACCLAVFSRVGSREWKRQVSPAEIVQPRRVSVCTTLQKNGGAGCLVGLHFPSGKDSVRFRIFAPEFKSSLGTVSERPRPRPRSRRAKQSLQKTAKPVIFVQFCFARPVIS